MKVQTLYALTSHVLTLKAHITKILCLCCLLNDFEASLTNSVDLDQTAPTGALIWVHTICVYTYAKQ